MAREHAPLARTLPYLRAAGQGPTTAGRAASLRRSGWSVLLGDRGLGDVLLALGLMRALVEGTEHDDLQYTGPRADLMRRLRPALRVQATPGPPRISSRRARPERAPEFAAVPEDPPAWMDLLDDRHAEIHAALPMRYYLGAEQELGVRLPADTAPLPAFVTTQRAHRGHVVFVSATSWAARKDYGALRFAQVAEHLLARDTSSSPWRFTLLSGSEADVPPCGPLQVRPGLDVTECVDVFGSAELVIGNDTGLTHLAAMTERADGSGGPQVVSLYGRHSHTKWTTGSPRHHAIATPFSDLLSIADRCPVRDYLDDASWAAAADLTAISPTLIAEYAGHAAGWW